MCFKDSRLVRQDPQSERRTLWRICGAYLITMHIDIVKVRLQTTSQYTSAFDGASQILKNEGPLAFYKVCLGLELSLYPPLENHFTSTLDVRTPTDLRNTPIVTLASFLALRSHRFRSPSP